MMLETAFEFTTNAAAQDHEAIEIRNPAGCGRRVRILRICITSGAQFSLFRLRRYAALATHGTGGDAPTQRALYRWDLADPAPAVEVWSGAPGTHLDWSAVGAADYDHPFQLDPSDAGDDDKLQPGQYLPADRQITIEPGTSASLGLPAGSETFIVKLLLEEMPELPAAHLNSALEAAGAWTVPADFVLPRAWTSVAFRVAYTAAGGSTNARPKWRIVWNDGDADWPQPIAQQEIDVTGAPVAFRAVYDLEERRTNVTAASATDTFAVAAERLPGARAIRLELAELGDTANPGSVVVTVTGA